jgi:hypothetical protein
MSTVADITDLLPRLNLEELQAVERALHAIYRQRSSGIIHDDAYGVWTEEEQAGVAREVWGMLDAPAKSHSQLNDQ